MTWDERPYWTTTTLFALAFLSGGAAYLVRVAEPLRGMAELAAGS
jgi:hypothetical protein